jgi:archaellum biogenesis ATPase FlaH
MQSTNTDTTGAGRPVAELWETWTALYLLSKAFPGESWSATKDENFSPSKARAGEYDTRLKEGRQAHPAEAAASAARSINEPLPYRDLLAQVLGAIRRGDQNVEMELRTELISRFRRNDSQINAELFRLLTAQESGSKAPTYGAVDMASAQPMHWQLDGFIPANDQVLLWGEAGTGKTTAGIAMAFAVIDGTGLLDRSAPATPAKVLFISSDSGQAPLMEVLERSGFSDHPALRDGRFTVWAHSKDEARKPWDASVAGCLALLDAVKQQEITLVLIDSCKAVTTKADLEYTSNPQVTALLTFFQEVLCEHCSVVWLNHDGTGKGIHAGAKAWREIPSMVHSIERFYPDAGKDGQGGKASDGLRCWTVRKCRMGAVREFHYELNPDTGRPQLTAAHAHLVVGDCSELVLQLLEQAHQEGVGSMQLGELVDAGLSRKYGSKTVKNTLSNLCRSRDLVRPARGRYALSPKRKEILLKEVHSGWDITPSNSSEREGFGNVPSLSRGTIAGQTFVPRNFAGTKANASEGLGFDGALSRDGWNPLGNAAQQTLSVDLPPSLVGSGADAFGEGDDPHWGPAPEAA